MDKNIAKKFLTQMLTIRMFEGLTAALHADKLLRCTLHHALGQEGVGVGVAANITNADVVFGGHRIDHIALPLGIDVGQLLAEQMGRLSGVSGGNAGPMHFVSTEHNFWGANGIVAASLPIAAGVALSKKMKNEPGVVVCFMGDGSTTEGSFHETMNMAALYEIPLLVVCENNFYAQTTSISRHSAVPQLSEKVREAYGVKTEVFNGNNLSHFLNDIKHAFFHVREEKKPFFAEVMTYRYSGHSISDKDQRYKDEAERAQWAQKDLIVAFTNYCIENEILEQSEISEAESDAKKILGQAISFNNLDSEYIDEIYRSN